MAAKRFAFPVMDALNMSSTHMAEVTHCDLPLVRDVLQRKVATATQQREAKFAESSFVDTETGALQCLLRVGDYVALPITIVGSLCHGQGGGSVAEDSEVLVHAPGLAGAFPVRLSELASFRGRVELSSSAKAGADGSNESAQLGSVCLLESIRMHGIVRDVLDRFYKRARRRSLACAGAAELLARGDEINVNGLALDFPYHCGGAHATKRFLDITEEACTHFSEHGKHGAKVLSRYGVAAAVGVAVDPASQVPHLFWHPGGAPAACLAPVLHGSRLLPVGTTKLAYNGPTSSCEMLHAEDPRRYMNPTVEGRYDCTTWLSQGLFGVCPGDPWRLQDTRTPTGRDGADSQHQLVVFGVAYDELEGEFELYLRDTQTGSIVPANDV